MAEELVSTTGLVHLRRPKWKVLAGVVLVVALAAGAWPAYRWWHDQRTARFRTAYQQAMEARDFKRAEQIADRWVAWDPANGGGWMCLAKATKELGDLEKTAACLGNLQDSDPLCLQALVMRGDLLFLGLNRPLEAVANWKRMLRIDPMADSARRRLIYYYAMTVQRHAMVEQIRTAISLHCEPPEAYTYLALATELRFSDGFPRVSVWLVNAPNDEALRVAQAYHAAKTSSSQALASFGVKAAAPGDKSLMQRRLEEYPRNLEVLAFYIEAAIFDGDAGRVAELLSRCPEMAEADSRFWSYKGWYHASRGELEAAETAYRKAIEEHPLAWRPRFELSSVLRRLGQHEECKLMTDVAVQGKSLYRKLLELRNAAAIEGPLLVTLLKYARAAGDKQVVSSLEYRGVRSVESD